MARPAHCPYRLPADDWLGYTTPISQLQPSTNIDFARLGLRTKGDAYIAITASAGMKLIKHGPGAYRELRSVGLENVWLVRWTSPRKTVLLETSSVQCFIRRLVLMASTWRCNPCEEMRWNSAGRVLSGYGVKRSARRFAHYDSPHCVCAFGATEMDIQYADWTLRLNLELSR